jgi:hypothetical protein
MLGVTQVDHSGGEPKAQDRPFSVNALRNSTDWRKCRKRSRMRYGNKAMRNNWAIGGF